KPKARADERHLLLDQEGDQQAEQEPASAAALEEIEGECQRGYRDDGFVEVIEVDVSERNEQEVDRVPCERIAPWQLQPGQQVYGPGAQRESEGLGDQERLRVGEREVERHQDQEQRREVVSEQGVGEGQRLAHGRFERPALGGVPEHLVEQAQVEPERVVGLVTQHRQR